MLRCSADPSDRLSTPWDYRGIYPHCPDMSPTRTASPPPPEDTNQTSKPVEIFAGHAHRDRPIAPPTASPDTRRGVARPGPAVRSTQDCASPRAVAASRAFFTLRDGDCPGCNWPILGCSSRIFRWGRRGSPGLVQGPTQRISSQLLTGSDDSAGSRQRLNRASISAAGTPACRDFMVHSGAFAGVRGHVQTRNSRAIR
jgi:hypothetical protein